MIIERDSDAAPPSEGNGETAPDMSEVAAPIARERIDAVASELRILLSLRTRTSARDRHLPILTDLLPPASRQDPDARFTALGAAVDAGIAAMPDADHSTAARALLGSGPGRWRPLSARGPEAAAPFGCGWDAYRRRRRSTGSSLLEETVELLARTLFDLSDGASGPDVRPGRADADAARSPGLRIGPPVPSIGAVDTPEAPSHPGQFGSDDEPSTPSRAKLAIGIVAVLAAVVSAGVLIGWAVGSGTDDTDSVDCGTLDRSVGETADDDRTLRSWSRAFEEHVAAQGLVDETRCASHLTAWRHGAIQRVGAGGASPVKALVGSSVDGATAVVVLEPSELRAFGRATATHGPHQGAPLGDVMGPLVGRSLGPDGEGLVRFRDGVFVTEATDSPTWAVLGRWVDIWEETGGLDGGLGRPVDDRRPDPTSGGLVQEFERGTISSSPDGLVQVITDQDHYVLSLPDDPRESVLVTEPRGLWWYVDAEGVRHFVNGSDAQRCLRTMAVPVITGQVSAAVATLPAGEGFQCP